MTRRLFFAVPIALATLIVAAPAFACGGLIGARGAVQLLRTVTLAGYHDGVEHYVTSFTFAGAGSGAFGSLVPLPGIPSKVERGGDWTLQRLEREVNPPLFDTERTAAGSFATAPQAAQVILHTTIDALDITVLKGGAREVGVWAQQNHFDLPPDAPEVLDFYARRSQIFMAARFNLNAARSRGLQSGDGTPIHLVIPTKNPWVPLRILGLGKNPSERIDADVFLLTDRAPAMLPAPIGANARNVPLAAGLTLARSQRANDQLLHDLHVDKSGSWVPTHGMWLTYLKLGATQRDLGYDLAIDASGNGAPSYTAAGFPSGLRTAAARATTTWVLVSAVAMLALVLAARRPSRGEARA